MDEAPKKKRSRAFRIRVVVLVLAGLAALTQIGRLNRFAITEGILKSHSPDPATLHGLLQDTPDPGPVMTRIWETGKLPHRWEIINYLNRNLGQRPELIPVIGDIVREAANDPDLTLRVTALNLLRLIDHPDWQPLANSALNDPDPLVRKIARVMLQRVGAPVQPAAPARQLPGPSFDQLVFHDFKQQPFPLSQFNGRPVLLHFFATWSPDCVKQIPDLVALRQLAPSEVALIGVSVDTVPGVRHDHSAHDDCEECEHGQGAGALPDLIKIVERHVILGGYNFPVLFDTTGVATAQLEGSELPVHVLLDQEHRLVRRYAGLRSAEVHDQVIRTLLGFETNSVITNQLTPIPKNNEPGNDSTN